uniref:Uncharacterized protein n=1 Tax=Anopheles culicifacies TaxID=139723 RepID=A0A182LYG8_9DIPT
MLRTVVPATVIIDQDAGQLEASTAPVTLCTISQPHGYRLPADIRKLSVEFAKPQVVPAHKIHTELVLTASVRPTIRTLSAEAARRATTSTSELTTTTTTTTALTATTPKRSACSIAPPEQQQQSNNASNLNVNQQTDANDKGKSKFLLPELNNFRKPPTVQVPVATILNDLSPVPAPVKVTNKITNSNPMSP